MAQIIDYVKDEKGEFIPKKGIKTQAFTKPLHKRVKRRRKKKPLPSQEFLTGIKTGLNIVDDILDTLGKFNKRL